MEVLGNLSVTQDQCGFDDSRDTRSGFEVTDVGLHRADGQGGGAAFPKNCVQSPCLGRISSLSSGPMSLHVIDGARCDARVLIDFSHQRFLRFAVR